MKQSDYTDLLEDLKKEAEKSNQSCPYCGRCPICGRKYNDGWYRDYERPVPYWDHRSGGNTCTSLTSWSTPHVR